MNAADVLCLPSRNEGMPNVVLEARASGLPVVATPAGACPEVPLDKACFLVTDSCSGKAIADGLRQILERRAATRTPDPVVPTWRQQAKTIVTLLQNPVVNL
jgi:glycosyltransferase involved in cell wall biosynthesis